MTRRLAAAALAAALVAPGAAAAEPIAVGVDRQHVPTALGRDFELSTTIANRGSAASGRLVAHLNVLSLDPGVYVDPEDWSSQRTRYLAPLAAGRSQTLRWRLKAVNAGSLAAYVAVVPLGAGSSAPTASPAVTLTVATRRTLDAGGILPLAAGIPTGLALLAVGVPARRRRRSGRAAGAGAGARASR